MENKEIKETKKNIYETLFAVMQDIPAIGKDSKNNTQGFYFRGVDAVTNILNPIFRKHNLVCVPTQVEEMSRDIKETKNGGTQFFTNLKMTYTFYAEDGSNLSVQVKGEGADSGDKSSNKAMAVALKYALCQTFLIPTEEKEPESCDNELSEEKGKCENCGKEFEPMSVNGKKLSSLQLMQISMKKYNGIALCKECGANYIKNIASEFSKQN